MYSDKSRGLIFSLFEDYSKSIYHSTSKYYLSESEKILKREYAKVVAMSDDLGLKEPFKNFRYNLSRKIENEFKGQINLSDDIYDVIEDYIINEVQKLYRTLNFGFSLKKHLFTQEMANNFIDWLIGYFVENGVEIKKEILDVLDNNQKEKMVYACLMNNKCCVCGKHTDTIHHVDRVGTTGYKNDNGVGKRIAPLCIYHHGEFHNSESLIEFMKKYPNFYWITLTPELVEKCKKLYKNYFEAFKEE